MRRLFAVVLVLLLGVFGAGSRENEKWECDGEELVAAGCVRPGQSARRHGAARAPRTLKPRPPRRITCAMPRVPRLLVEGSVIPIRC